MINQNQLSIMEGIFAFSRRKKTSRSEKVLSQINGFVNWQTMVKPLQVIDKSNTEKGGRKPLPIEWKVKMLFVQFLYDLSDPELENQLTDRLSFQRFVGIPLDQEIPDFTTLWRFKEALIEAQLKDTIFESIITQLESHGLLLKRGTIVDATISESSNRPLSDKKREELKQNPSSQIDTDAHSTKKNGQYYFGYKGHIGTDAGSDLIRRRAFTPAQVHDKNQLHELCSGDEKFISADSAYNKDSEKKLSREMGLHYGIIDKARRARPLSNKQKKRNGKYSSVRAAVEHPFAYMKTKLNMGLCRAKNISRNGLRFDMFCNLYNVMRGIYLLKKKEKLAVA